MSSADVLIIGGGPAGLSAALTLVRQNHPVLVFDKGRSRALASFRLHGVLGADAKAPEDTLKSARAELEAYKGFKAVSAEVVEIKKVEDLFQVTDDAGTLYQGKRVILANGVTDCFPDIEGYAEAWGKRIFHNPFAQGYQPDPTQSRSGVLAVDWIAMPKYTLHLVHLLAQLTSTVTVYTHGNKELGTTLQPLFAESPNQAVNVKIDNRLITRLSLESNDSPTIQVHFEDGTYAEEAFLGHAAITKLNGPFAEQLGIDVSPTGAEYVVSGPTNKTNIRGVYAAGDAMGMFKVWPNAVASGAVTASGVAIGLQEEAWGFDPIFG